MLKMQTDQLQVFAEVKIKYFKDRVLQHLQEHFPDEASPTKTSALDEWMDRCMRRALSCGIHSEQGLCKYVVLEFFLEANGVGAQARRQQEDIESNKKLGEQAKLKNLYDLALGLRKWTGDAAPDANSGLAPGKT